MKKLLSGIKKWFNRLYRALIVLVSGWNLRNLAKAFVSIAVVFLLAGSYLWYTRLYLNNDRRFWMAIENSMATPSVTRTLNSGGTGNKVVQTQQFFCSPQMATRSHVSYEQKNAVVNTTVETEGLSFVGADYSRYTSFNTNQKKEDGSSPNLDSVLNKWESSEYTDEELDNSRLNYISEHVSLVVFGNFDANTRHEFIRELKDNNAYTITNVTESTEDGRKLLSYSVKVNLKAYTTLLQKAFTAAGFGEFPPLNPDNYKEGVTINSGIRVDKNSGEVVGVSFGSRTEVYNGYGIQINVQKPDAEFSSGQLQEFVQQEIGTAL